MQIKVRALRYGNNLRALKDKSTYNIGSVPDVVKLQMANLIAQRAKYYCPISKKKSIVFKKDNYGYYTGEFYERVPGNLRNNIRVEEYTRLRYINVQGNNGITYQKAVNTRGYVVVSDVPYSIYVHELTMNRHEAPTRAKYLETAGIEVSNIFNDSIYLSIEYGGPPNGFIKIYIDDDSRGSQLV